MIEELTAQLTTAQAETAALSAELEAKTQQVSETTTQQEEQTTLLATVTQQAEVLQETLVTEQTRLQEAVQNIVELEHQAEVQLGEFQKVHQHDQEEIATLTERLAATQSTVDGLREEMESLQVENGATARAWTAVRPLCDGAA